MLFINKSNTDKSFVEFISINCLFVSDDLKFIKNKIKENLDDNFLFLIESNIISPCKFKLIINDHNGIKKEFHFEPNEIANQIDQNNDEYMDETDDGTEENGLSLLKDELHLVQ